MAEPLKPGGQLEAQHETRDVNAARLIQFAIWLAVLVVAGLVASFVSYRYFVVHQSLGPPASPFENVRTLPPPPRLQVQPSEDLKTYLNEENGVLDTYGWVDRKNGVVRIPIAHAMELLLRKGLPVRANPSNPDAATQTAGRNAAAPPADSAQHAGAPPAHGTTSGK